MKFLVRKAPENFLKTVNDEINSLLNRHFDTYFPEAAYWEDEEKFSIPLEIKDENGKYEICAELPGIKKENLDIDIDRNYMTIKAKKEEEKITEKNSYKKSEFKYGEFARTVYFPEEINVDEAHAKINNGILHIEIPKFAKEKQEVKKLTVE